jgi:hypothetical protein
MEADISWDDYQREKKAGMDLIMMQAFRDELEKIAGIMDDAAREGIQLAKTLKSRNLVGKLKGNTLKDYYHHMDLSAHPKFKAGVKVTTEAPKVKVAWAHGAELAGLGMLAAPTIQKMRGKPMKDKNKDRAEVAGLGVLAAPSVAHYGGSAVQKLKGLAGKAAKVAVTKHAGVDVWNPTTGKILGEAASKAKSIASGASKAAPRVRPDGKALLDQIRGMKRVGQTGTISASNLPKAASVYLFDKEAFIGKLLGKAAPAAKSAFKPSFAGHAKALGTGAATNARGVTTTRNFNDFSKTLSQKKHIEIPGLS